MLPSEIIDFRGTAIATAKDSAEGFIVGNVDIEALRRARTTAEPLNMLAQLQMPLHVPGYDAAQFAQVDGFGRPIQSTDEHRARMRDDIASLIRRGILKAPTP